MTTPTPAIACARCHKVARSCKCPAPYLVPDPSQGADLTDQPAAAELQALLGVPDGTQGVRLPD